MIRKTFLMLAFALTAGLTGPAMSQATADDITIDHPWSRATAPNAPNGAAFMTIRNSSSTPARLVSASTGRAERVELHTHRMEDGLMKMRQVEGIEIPAHGAAELKPGGLHVMMFGLKTPLVEGEAFPVELRFENGATRTVEVKVMKAGTKMPMMGSGHDGGHGGSHGNQHGDGQHMHGNK